MKRIADVVAETFGRNCEAVVHDLSKLDQSLIHIAGDVTHRSPGAPITDLVLRVLRQEGDGAKDLVSYKTITRDGRILKSSTVFIRDDKGKIVGAFCINFDITEFLNSLNLIQEFVRFRDADDDRRETFSMSVQEAIDALVNQAVSLIGKQPPSMDTEEKIRLVAYLEERGAFLIRGAVDYVATILGVSKYTIYSYLQKIRSTRGLNTI
ncbi:helix-turn-helix transcriptional regulator [Ammonifex degensii]|uniref:helix-turn-helix transcriptional regulator n=1 Tax=Ammonifex degensii TaxID=42838 RepID=UPI001FE152CA|nr:helix-turn-helix transcriptional regulator [Ammonifex degensii]